MYNSSFWQHYLVSVEYNADPDNFTLSSDSVMGKVSSNSHPLTIKVKPMELHTF